MSLQAWRRRVLCVHFVYLVTQKWPQRAQRITKVTKCGSIGLQNVEGSDTTGVDKKPDAG